MYCGGFGSRHNTIFLQFINAKEKEKEKQKE
jgi:hypothetical protein